MKKQAFQSGTFILILAILIVYFQNCKLQKSANSQSQTASESSESSMTTTTIGGCSAGDVAGHCD